MRFPLCFVPHFPCVCVPLSCFHFLFTCSSLCFTPRSPCLPLLCVHVCTLNYVSVSLFWPPPLSFQSILFSCAFLPPSHVSCHMLNLCLSVSCFVSAVSCVQCVQFCFSVSLFLFVPAVYVRETWHCFSHISYQMWDLIQTVLAKSCPVN